MLKIVSKVAGYAINIPTQKAEITNDIFNSLLENVKIPNNYCIVAVLTKDTLFGIMNLMNNKNSTALCTTVLAKEANTESAANNFKQGEEIVVSRSGVETATHLNVQGNLVSTRFLIEFIKKDDKLVDQITNGRFDRDLPGVTYRGANPYVYTIDFKIVPLNLVHASVDKTIKSVNPFKEPITKIELN